MLPVGNGVVKLLSRGVDQLSLKVRDEALGLQQQPAVLEAAAPQPLLHALDQHGVLGADLIVELEHVCDPRVVHVRADEVVEEAARPLGARGTTGPIERFGWPGMTLIVMFGQRKWNWPRSIGPRGSKSPFHASRTGPYWVENVGLCSST